jgi:hypothetical protein
MDHSTPGDSDLVMDERLLHNMATIRRKRIVCRLLINPRERLSNHKKALYMCKRYQSSNPEQGIGASNHAGGE